MLEIIIIFCYNCIYYQLEIVVVVVFAIEALVIQLNERARYKNKFISISFVVLNWKRKTNVHGRKHLGAKTDGQTLSIVERCDRITKVSKHDGERVRERERQRKRTIGRAKWNMIMKWLRNIHLCVHIRKDEMHRWIACWLAIYKVFFFSSLLPLFFHIHFVSFLFWKN